MLCFSALTLNTVAQEKKEKSCIVDVQGLMLMEDMQLDRISTEVPCE